VPTSAAPIRRRRSRWGGDIRQQRRRLVSYALLGSAIVLMVHALVGENGYLAGVRRQREYDRIMADYRALQTENAQLRNQARRLKDDPTAMEEAARRDLGLIRPGETLVIVKDVE
jgi:cell division protein FtsB